MSKRLFIVATILAVALIAFVSWQFLLGVGQNLDPIRIGVITELSGGLADASVQRGASLALERELAGSAVAGRRVELVYKDDQSDPRGAAAAVRELVNDPRIFAIISPYPSALADAAADEAEKQGVLLLLSGPAAPSANKRTDGTARTWVYRVAPSDATQGRALAAYARTQTKTAGVLTDAALAVTDNTASAFKTSFQLLDGAVAVEDMFSAGDADFSSQLKRLKLALGFSDLVLLSAQPADAARIVVEARAEGVYASFFGSTAWGGRAMIAACGETCEGLRMAAYFAPDAEMPAVQDFAEAYKNKYGEYPDEAAALAYDAVHLSLQTIGLAIGVDQDMRLTREEIATRVGLSGIDGVTGKISYLAGSHDPEKGVMIVEVREGKLQWVEEVEP